MAAWLRAESLAAAAGLEPPVAALWPLAERVRASFDPEGILV